MPDNQPMFKAKVTVKRKTLPSAPIHIKLDAAQGDPNDPNRTDIPTRPGLSTLKSQARSSFGASTKPYRGVFRFDSNRFAGVASARRGGR